MEESLGVDSFSTRVESWECDFNGHWNTRFYVRSLEMASEVIADMAGEDAPAAQTLHIRFHHELFIGAPVRIRSATVADGSHGGATAHFLESEGRIAAAALCQPGLSGTILPKASSEAARPALPRGITSPLASTWQRDPADILAELGLVRPAETDHRGRLTMDEVLRRAGTASHELLANLGFTVDFTKETGVGRMLVEARIARLAPCPAGSRILVRSRLAARSRSSFTTAHLMQSPRGEVLGMVELCMVAVDMAERRATRLPSILLSAQLAGS